MIKRTIDISDGPTFLSIELDQLVLTRSGAELARIPCEDIGLLLVDHRDTTYTHTALARLVHFGAAVVVSGENHLPAGLLLSLADNELIAQRHAAQAVCKLPVKKQLWRQIVRQKIRAQADNLPSHLPQRRKMLALADRVRSGDPANAEGQAAQVYWTALFGPGFRRDPDGPSPNSLLNYGYAVLRAAVARAIVAAGLSPALGLHHHNRSNAFCLADDLLEPLRPLVDAAVVDLVQWNRPNIDKVTKSALLGLLTREITVADQSGPMMVGLHRYLASLVRCYEGTAKMLELPTWPVSKGVRSQEAEGETKN